MAGRKKPNVGDIQVSIVRQRKVNPWHFIIFSNSFQQYQVFKMHIAHMPSHNARDAPFEKRC